MSFLSTILSLKPCCNKNSALWNPFGNFCFIVCSITLGPAKPIKAFGSAKITSPKLAKLAVTPPVVGSVKTDIYSSPASLCFAKAADVFAICISEIIPSCILAPPDTQKIISGIRFSIDVSIVSVILSPTQLPILPIMKFPSIIAIATSFPFIFPGPHLTASSIFVFCFNISAFFRYPSKFNGSAVSRFSPISSNVPSSMICFILLLAEILKCFPQFIFYSFLNFVYFFYLVYYHLIASL